MWTHGYFTAQPYPAYVITKINPHYLRFLASLQGFRQASPDRAFRYCELGCGVGATVLSLAAANPEAEFVGIDFMPAHIERARSMALKGGLHNVKLLQRSFESLNEDPSDLGGPFDFIVLHGVYSWVGPESRAAIDALLASHLRDGGLAYVCYNAMPGSTARVGLTRVLYALRDAEPKGESDAFASARGALDHLMASVPTLNPQAGWLQTGVAAMRASDEVYAKHEYFNENSLALYCDELERLMAACGLAFVANANRGVVSTYELMEREVCAEVPSVSRAAARVIGDFGTGRSLRCDLFGKNLERNTDTSALDWLARTILVRRMDPRELQYPIDTEGPNYSEIRPLAERLFAGTARGPISVGDALAGAEKTPPPAPSDQSLADALLLLLDLGAIEVRSTFPDANEVGADAWNHAVVSEALGGTDEYPMSSVTVGGPWVVPLPHKLAIAAVSIDGVPIDALRLTDWLLPRMPVKFKTVRNGSVSNTPESTRSAVLEWAQHFVECSKWYAPLGLLRRGPGNSAAD
jgi:predicted O-methyltransferase YrrM